MASTGTGKDFVPIQRTGGCMGVHYYHSNPFKSFQAQSFCFPCKPQPGPVLLDSLFIPAAARIGFIICLPFLSVEPQTCQNANTRNAGGAFPLQQSFIFIVIVISLSLDTFPVHQAGWAAQLFGVGAKVERPCSLQPTAEHVVN